MEKEHVFSRNTAGILNGQDNFILPTWVANQNEEFGFVTLLTEQAI